MKNSFVAAPVGLPVARIARAIAGSAIAIAVTMSASDSEAYDAGTYGGPGGGSFRMPCSTFDVLVGVQVRQGSVLDAVGPICSPLNTARTDWAGAIYKPGLKGGGGGRPNEVMCRRGDALHGLTVAVGAWGDGTMVKSVYLRCRDLDSANTYSVSLPALSAVSGERTFSCNAGDWGTGLIGKSGTLVDRLGLSCGRIPPVIMTPPSSEASKPTRPFGRGAPRPKTKEECEAVGSTWIAEKGRCLGPAALSALRAVCEKKGPGHRYDLPSMECVGPQGGGQPGGGENACRVLKPGTVYDGPGGNQQGTLEAGTEGVSLLGKDGTDWYHVKWPAGQGWVYSGPGYEDAIACP